ncbi:hypothetical protein HDU76_011115, partial [Blyttiomyces sp. JEL0837]
DMQVIRSSIKLGTPPVATVMLVTQSVLERVCEVHGKLEPVPKLTTVRVRDVLVRLGRAVEIVSREQPGLSREDLTKAALKTVVTLKSEEVSEEGESTPRSVSPAERSAYEVMVEKSAARKRRASTDLTSGDEKGEERKKTVLRFPNPLKGKATEGTDAEKIMDKIAERIVALEALPQREGRDVASGAGGSSMEATKSGGVVRDIGGMTSEGVIFRQEPGGGYCAFDLNPYLNRDEVNALYNAHRLTQGTSSLRVAEGIAPVAEALISSLQRMELLVKRIAEGDKDALAAVRTQLGTALKAQVTGTQFGAIRDNLKE